MCFSLQIQKCALNEIESWAQFAALELLYLRGKLLISLLVHHIERTKYLYTICFSLLLQFLSFDEIENLKHFAPVEKLSNLGHHTIIALSKIRTKESILMKFIIL